MIRTADVSEMQSSSEIGIARFLAQFSAASRAEALHLALQALRARVEPDRVLACELAWEVHTHGYWSHVRRADGTVYDSEETYFREVLEVSAWRTAYKRLAIGRTLTSFEEPERTLIRTAIAEVGLAKAAIVAPAIERLRAWTTWLELARTLPAVTLQARVSEALQSLPRGREPSPPGERFRQFVLGAMPDIEAMEVVERFFEVGAEVVGTHHAVGIFLAGCRECLAEWEIQAARRHRTHLRRNDVSDADIGERPGDVEGEDAAENPTVRPRGQNRRASAC